MLEVLVAMGVLSVVVTSLMGSIQSAQSNIQQARQETIALLQCNAALEEIRFAWSLNPTLSNTKINTSGALTELTSTTSIPKPDTSPGAPSVAYRARYHELGGAPGVWYPAMSWTPAGSAPPAPIGGILIVQVQSYIDLSTSIVSIATLTAFLAREP